MSLAVLRAVGQGFDVAAFVAEHQVVCESMWRAGEPDRLGRITTTSGFTALVAEAAQSSALADECARWLGSRVAMLTALAAAGAAPRLDLGVFVGEARPVTSVLLSEELLALCVQLGVAVEFSAYASHDPRTGAV